MQCTVESIHKDEAGLSLYLEQYKPFRLLSLKRDPSSFGSTFDREQAFNDQQWRDRLFNPRATTFVARSINDSQRILSSITLIGPSPTPDLIKPAISLNSRLLHWELNGVFTLPESRRQGIAAVVMNAAKAYALHQSASNNSSCVLTVVVYTDNIAAKSWYEKMGFNMYNSSEDQGRPTSELVLVLTTGDADANTA